MQLSDRILQIKPSPTLAITAHANALKAQGVDIIGFGSGEPDFDTPQHIKDAAIKAINEGKTKYTAVGGIPQLKEAIVDKFKRDNNLIFEKNEVTVNCGGKHSFFNLMQVILNEGDEVIVPTPYWVSYPSMVMLAGGTPVILETTEESELKISPDQLKAAITPKTKAIVLNSPSNPSGVVYSKAELQALVDVVENKDIIFITDDIYESILYTDTPFCNVAMLSDDIKKRTIILNGVSKTYSMTGWRIGYMAGNADIIKKVEIIQSQSTSNPCSISQHASIAALAGDQTVVKEMVKAFTRRRTTIVEGLNAIPGITCKYPDGAFYVFPNVSEIANLKGWKEIESSLEGDDISSKFTSYLLDKARVAVVPGIAFGANSYIRLSFATSDENIEQGLKRIKEAVDQLV